MAIASHPATWFPRLRRASRQRSYARQLIATWEASLPGRLVPQVAKLELTLVGPANEHTTLGAALAEHLRVVICGRPGSGRSLALEQLMLRWSHGTATIPALFPLRLQATSAPNNPEGVLLAAMDAAGFRTDPLLVERGLAAGHWLLLIDDWDMLPETGQERWKRWVLERTRRYPMLAVVVVAGETPPAWPDFRPYALPPIERSQLEAWLPTLFPDEEPSLMLAPLTGDARARLASGRVADLGLLAFTYGQHGFSANRGRLYANALDRLLRPIAGNDVSRVRTALAQVAWQAATTPPPHSIPEVLRAALPALGDLLTVSVDGRAVFGRSWYAHAALALHVAARPELIDLELSAIPWEAVLPLAAGLMADPEPLYAVLRGPGAPEGERALFLGICLREHHVALPGWSTAIVGALARLASADPARRERALALLETMPDVVGTTVAEQLAQGPAGERWALGLARQLPLSLAEPYILDMLADSRLMRTTRRVAALLLREVPLAKIAGQLRGLVARNHDLTGRLLALQLLVGAPPERRWIAEQLQTGRFLLPRPADPTEARMIVEVCAALLGDTSLDSAVHTMASLALQGCVSETTAPGLLQACAAPSAPLREAARRALLTADVGLALRAFGRLVLGDDVHWTARHEALRTLLRLQGPGIERLFERIIRSDLPLAGRAEVVAALADRQHAAASPVLPRLLLDAQIDPGLRSVIAGALGRSRSPEGLRALLAAALDPQPLPVRIAAVEALSGYHADEVPAVLAGIVERERSDLGALLAAIQALGARQDESGIWALRTVLLGPLESDFLAAWNAGVDPITLDQPPASWALSLLPPLLLWRHGRALATATTSADVPTSLAELVRHEVQLVRTAAAHALSAIGGPSARDVLREVLLAASSADSYGPAPAFAAELVQLDGVPDLVQTVHSHRSPLIRWVAAQTLHIAGQGDESLRAVWNESSAFDPATRAALLTALGSDRRIIPLLETLIVDDQAPLHLRLDAVQALGRAGAAHAEGLLLALVSSAHEEPTLSAAALDVLEPPITHATLVTVRGLLRAPRPPVDVAAAALRCLVRAADTESLPLFLRYAQHESPTLALPAIDGLRICNDATANALLARLANTSNKGTRIRLHALGALLQLEGPVHLSAIRRMAETGSVATRLAALELLIPAVTDPSELVAMVRLSWPLALRLRVAQALAAAPSTESLALLEQLLADPREGLALRTLALETLAEARYAPALALFESLALDEEAPLALRRRAIRGLMAWPSEPTTILALSALAEAPHPALRTWALQTLMGEGR